MKVMKAVSNVSDLCSESDLENTVIKYLLLSLLFTLVNNKLILNTPFWLTPGKNDGLNFYIRFTERTS